MVPQITTILLYSRYDFDSTVIDYVLTINAFENKRFYIAKTTRTSTKA
jgi:hypothetical protein